MTDDAAFDQGAGEDAPGTKRRLQVALSCSAVAALLLVGDFSHQLEARATSAAAAKQAQHQRPPRHTKWTLVIPWIISLLSVVALIIVIVVTT